MNSDSEKPRVIEVEVAEISLGAAGVLGALATNAFKIGENELQPTLLRTLYLNL